MARGSIAPELYQDILDHKREHPDITPQDLAVWAKNAFDLARTPRTSTINFILSDAHETLEAHIDPIVLSPLLNKALEYWIVHRQSRSRPPTKGEIRKKAQIFAADIGLAQGKPGFAATWWTHFEQLHRLSYNHAKGDYAVSKVDRSLLASSEWTDEQLLDLAFEYLEQTVEDPDPKSEPDVPAAPSPVLQPTPMDPSREAPSRIQRHFVRRQRTRYPDASHGAIAEYARRKFGIACAPSEATIASILSEAPDAAMPVSPKLGVSHRPARLTEVQRARIYQYAQCNPEFSYSTIATWAYYELGLHRKLAATEVEGIIHTFQSDSGPNRQQPPRASIPPLTSFQRRQIRKKRDRNPSSSAMALMCWAKSEFRLPGAPSATDISDILSICDDESEDKPSTGVSMSKIPLKNNHSHRGHEHRAKSHRPTPWGAWIRKDSNLLKPHESSDPQGSGKLAQDRLASFQDTTLWEPRVDSLTRSWLFSIPSLGVIGCLTSETLHNQRMAGSTVGSSDDDANLIGKNSRGHERPNITTHDVSGCYEVVSDDGGDEADDENDDACGGYYNAIHTTVDRETVGKQSEGVRTRIVHRKSSAVEEVADLEHSDRIESRYDSVPTTDQRTTAHCKEDQMGVDRLEEDSYMDMDVEEASCILSAMGIAKEIENSVVEGKMGPNPAQSWTPEQQSISIQVALTTLDPNDLTQRSAYVVLLDMSRRITTLDHDECFREHLRAFSQRWSQEEQLQSLFTVATLLDMQNPFHFAAYVVLTNRYNKIKEFE
ncbi:hypothetical protein BGZ68_009771 [Mortierella alpina]|nr:hypothetical protein BGZ68_009771 [Mortierella alpina]